MEFFKNIFKKKQRKTKEELLMDEFNSGKVILPIDKRDFEDFEDFKNKSSSSPDIKEKIKNIDSDFENLDIKIRKNNNDK